MDYAFPPDSKVSEEARALVKEILAKDPSKSSSPKTTRAILTDSVLSGKRPSLEEILTHPWFFSGSFPTELSSASLQGAPTFPAMSPEQIQHNFRKLKRRCAVGRELPLSKNVPDQPPKSVPGVVASPVQARQAVNQAIARQEEEFKRAVAPDSPISTLLSCVYGYFPSECVC